MPDESQAQMHADFPRWYREVDIEAKREESRERIRARWSGISSLIATLNREDVPHLLHIVFRDKRGVTEQFLTRFRQAFKDVDDMFDMQGNEREVEILAGALLAARLEGDDDESAWTALAITTCLLGGARALPLPIDLGGLAENTITRISERHRKRPSTDGMKLVTPKFDFSKAKEKIVAMDGPTLGSAFDQAAATVAAVLTNVAKQLNSSLETVSTYLTIQDEELNMLWWVLGERSDGTGQSFVSMPKASLPIASGYDLAAYTVYLPGPQSVRGLLTKASLSDADSVTIPETVNACERPLLEKIVDGSETSSLIQPIHFAIERKLETGDDASWIPGWAAKTGLDASRTSNSLSLAVLFYRERLLSIF